MKLLRLPLTMLCAALWLSACAPSHHAVHAVQFRPLAEEMDFWENSGLCTFQHGPNIPLTTNSYAYGCHGGKWGSVSLLMNTYPSQPSQTRKVRLLWKNWKAEARPINEEPVAAAFLYQLARRYAPETRDRLVSTFLQDDDTVWSTTHTHFDYTHTDKGQYYLHRLVLSLK